MRAKIVVASAQWMEQCQHMQTKFIKTFLTESRAMEFVRLQNIAMKAAGNHNLLVVAPGPDDNFAVMDIKSAIELGIGYQWVA